MVVWVQVPIDPIAYLEKMARVNCIHIHPRAYWYTNGFLDTFGSERSPQCTKCTRGIDQKQYVFGTELDVFVHEWAVISLIVQQRWVLR